MEIDNAAQNEQRQNNVFKDNFLVDFSRKKFVVIAPIFTLVR